MLPVIEYSSFIWGVRPFDQISKIQNNLMRSFLGVGRNAPIFTLIRDMGWVPISIITKLSCIRFWQRLSNMSHDRLNYKIFTESCRLAENGKKNWASSTKVYLNYLIHTLDLDLPLLINTFYSITKIWQQTCTNLNGNSR